MRHIGTLFLLLMISHQLFAQNMGNAKYKNDRYNNYNYQKNNRDKLQVNVQRNGGVLLSIRGLNNVKPDAYVAVFNIKQVGSSATEVNQLMDRRIQPIQTFVNNNSDLEMHEDMISFVPIYEYVTEKKLFSKKTYNEIPKGFEMQKNLHIKYTNASSLKLLLAICAESEIYDLVKVDYYSTQLEQQKKVLEQEVRKLILAKKDSIAKDLGYDFTTYQKDIADGFEVIYPVDQYSSYAAYSSTSLRLTKSAKVNNSRKSSSYYFDPVKQKFDLVINPIVVAPQYKSFMNSSFYFGHYPRSNPQRK